MDVAGQTACLELASDVLYMIHGRSITLALRYGICSQSVCQALDQRILKLYGSRPPAAKVTICLLKGLFKLPVDVVLLRWLARTYTFLSDISVFEQMLDLGDIEIFRLVDLSASNSQSGRFTILRHCVDKATGDLRAYLEKEVCSTAIFGAPFSSDRSKRWQMCTIQPGIDHSNQRAYEVDQTRI
jgi:hypothetical protein